MKVEMREKTIEASFLKMLKKKYPAITAVKLNLIGRRSWPDRLLILPGGLVCFIEFKSSKGVVTDKQQDVHEYLSRLNHHVLVTCDANEAMEWLDHVLMIRRGSHND